MIIESSGISLVERVKEYRRYGTLFLFLAIRDIRLRYRQTFLGLLWSVLQPLVPMVIFTLVFSRLLRPETDGVPYYLFALGGLTPWMFFANSINAAGATFVQNANLLNKVYFPRAIMPAAAIAAYVLDWLIATIILSIFLTRAGYSPSLVWLCLPLIIVFAAIVAVGVGVAVASLSAVYRDVKHALPFVVQVWMYATPVVYPIKLVSKRLQWVLAMNPMTGVVEATRACLFGLGVDWPLLSISMASALLILAAATALFHKVEADLAERV